MSNELKGALLAWAWATPLWLLFWAVWSGRLRWMDDAHVRTIINSVVPGSAAASTVAGLAFWSGRVWLLWVAAVLFVAGLVLSLVDGIWAPRWMQPKWYREQQGFDHDDGPRSLRW